MKLPSLDIERILAILPHRVPFVLVASGVDEAAPAGAVRAATLLEAVLALCE